MENSEQDDEKRELLRKSEMHREEIEGDVRTITENTERMITNALVIGGTLLITYLLVRQFSGSGKGKRKHKKVRYVDPVSTAEVVQVQEEKASEPGVLGQVGAAIAGQASVFLLNLAKEKLTEFIQAMSEKKSAS